MFGGSTPAISAGSAPTRVNATTVSPCLAVSSAGVPSATSVPARQHADAVGEMFRLVEVVGRQQHRRAEPAEVFDQLPRLAARSGIESGRRLVEEQHLRSSDDAEREVEPTLLTT